MTFGRRYKKRIKHLLSTFVEDGRAVKSDQDGEVRPLSYAIDRYAYFHGIVHISGWVFAAGRRIRAITLVSSTGRYPVRSFDRQSPDVAAQFGPAAGACRFDEAIVVASSAADISRAQLEIRFRSGEKAVFRDIGMPVADPAHLLYARFHGLIRERPCGRALEVGSRARSGIVRRDTFPEGWGYSGLDILSGPNVDVVGDAHQLSGIYPAECFDAVMALSVLEHLLMPWKFIVELNRVLKIGAVGFFSTHQCWPLHDQPWDFWRFSDRAWSGLLNGATGFEIIDANMGEPAYVVAAKCHPITAFADLPAGALASTVLFRKIGPTDLDWPVELSAVAHSMYPEGTISFPTDHRVDKKA